MGFFKELIAKQRYPAILLVGGIVLLFLGYYALSGDLTKPQLNRTKPQPILLLLGIICTTASGVLFLVDEDFVAYRRGCRVSSTKNGFEAKFRESSLLIDFGLLQDLYIPSDAASAVVLPANEFFDERCFEDTRTAAGAFVQKYFSKSGGTKLRALVHEKLTNHQPEAVLAGSDLVRHSYGLGTCVYLGEPLGQHVRMIFAAVASDRQPHGLRAELSTIFRAVEEVKCTLATERLTTVFVPLLGAGKGGVPAEIAFMTLLSALLEARCRDGGHHLKEMHIVIFQSDTKPEVPRRKAKRALRQMVSLYQEMSR